MALNIPQVPFKLTAEDMGATDYGQALRSGFNTFSKMIESAYKPKTMAEALLAQQLSNKINKPKAEHAEEITLADLAHTQAGTNSLNANTGLVPFHRQLLEAQTKKALRPEKTPLDAYGKAVELYHHYADMYGQDSKEAQDAAKNIENVLAGKNGITVIDPVTGNPMVQIGGSSGGRSGGGKTFQTQEGEILQQPTQQILSQLQNRVVGERLVKPYIESIVKTLPQFQSKWTQAEEFGSGIINKWFGGDIDLPSQLAEGKASLGLAAEGMLRQFGLNATGHNLKRMEQILTPGENESKDGYKRRAIKQSIQFAKNSLEAQLQASRGIGVGNAPGKSITIDRLNEPGKAGEKEEIIDWTDL